MGPLSGKFLNYIRTSGEYMKRLAICVLALITTSVWSKCEVDQIRYSRSTSWGLNLGEESSEFGQKVTVNIPLVIDGEPACYHQKNGINVRAEEIDEGKRIDYEITPLEASFENVPSPAVFQYLMVEYDQEMRASRVQIMSFLCSGERPIGADAFSDSLVALSEKTDEASTGVNIFIATGQAAENISVSQAKKARVKVYDKFLEIFESRSEELATIEEDQSNIYIPNILAGISIEELTSVDRKLYSNFFTRTNSSINGCSKNFREKMQDLLLENVAKNHPFKGIVLKKKRFSSKYRMRWTL